MAGAAADKVVLLKDDLLLEGVNTFTKLAININDIKKPSPERIQSIYGELASLILGCSENQMCQLPLHMLELVNSQDQFSEESVGLLLFSKSLGYVFELCLIDNFTIGDILCPKYKRTRYLLSAIINFLRSRLSHEEDKIQASEKLEAFKKADESLEKKQTLFSNRIDELKQLKIQREEKIQEIDLNALRIHDQTLSVQQEKSDKLLLQQQQELEELQNIKIITKASTLLHIDQQAIEEKRVHDHNLNSKENVVNALYDFAPTAKKWLEKVEEYSMKYMETSKSCETIQSKNTEIMMKINDKIDEIKNINQTIQKCVEKKSRRKQKRENKKNELTSEKNEFVNYKADLLEKINQINSALNECAEEHRKLTEQKYLEKGLHKQAMLAMHESFEELQESFAKYNDCLSGKHQHLADSRKVLLMELETKNV